MDSPRENVEDVLAEKPDLEDAFGELLDVDEREGEWTFDDVPLDSGEFGELVSRGIVEKHDDGTYSLADPEAVAAVLDGDTDTQETHREDGEDATRSLPELPSVGEKLSSVGTLTLVALLGVVALVRTVPTFGAVFRSEVVLTGNDPYATLHDVETLLQSDLSPFSIGSLQSLPDSVESTNTLLEVTTWWIASLLGGGAGAARLVLATYPVVSAVLSAVVVYLLCTMVFEDGRIGLAAVTLLAFLPAHVQYTSLGFGDHHAFDLFLLSLLVYSTARLVNRQTEYLSSLGSWRTWGSVGLLGVTVAAQSLSWVGSPLILVPLGVFVAGKAYVDLAGDRSPLMANSLLLVGIGTGGVLAFLVHLSLGWMPTYVALAPLLLAGGLTTVVAALELGDRSNADRRVTAGLTVLAAGVVGIAGWTLTSAVPSAVGRFVDFVVYSGQSNIAETFSLFGSQTGTIFGVIAFFGGALLVAAPFVLIGFREHGRERADYLLLATFTGWFFLLSILQLRFAGQLSIFVAIFGGVGFVRLAQHLEVLPDRETSFFELRSVRSPPIEVPSPSTAVKLVVTLLVVLNFSVFFTYSIPSQMGVPDATYQTANWIDAHAESRGLEYPENYVFSAWDRNRVYNYFVNGESSSYNYALFRYDEFLAAQSLGNWSRRLRGRYVVTSDRSAGGDLPPESMHTRLHRYHGSKNGEVGGLGEYRLVHVSDDRSTKVFYDVAGARLTGTAGPNATLEVSTNVTVSGVEFEYVREVRTDADGRFEVTVPYPGEYHVAGEVRSVSKTAVENGDVVRESES